MKKSITSSILLIIILMNVFFDMSISHHSDFSKSKTQSECATFEIAHENNSCDQNPAEDDCSNGTCHSGYCKLVNLNTINYRVKNAQPRHYSKVTFLPPESPYLLGNRRPPKFA